MSNETMPQQNTPQWPAPVARPPKNGFGTTALVTGIIAVVFAFIPVVGLFVSLPLAVLALLFGALGMMRAFQGKATNKAVSITGTTLGAAAIVISVLMSMLVYSAADAASKALNDNGAGSKPVASHASGAKATAGIGDPVRDGKFAFTVRKVRTGVDQVGGNVVGEKADGQYVIVAVTVKNVGHESQMFLDSAQYVYTKAGDKYDAAAEADLVLDGSNAFLNDINPGNTVKGKVAFDMPKSATPDTIELHDSMFSDGVTVNLK